MPISDEATWRQIAKYPLPFRAERDEMADPPLNCTCFEHNLRKDGDWTDESAERLIEEYRRCVYLRAVAREAIALPPLIAGVAGMLADLRDPLAKDILPSDRGLDAPPQKATIRTQILYRREFGWPPADIWPRQTARRIETIRIWLLRVGIGGFMVLWSAFFIGGLGLTVLYDAEMLPRKFMVWLKLVGSGDVIDLERAATTLYLLILLSWCLGPLASLMEPKRPAKVLRE